MEELNTKQAAERRGVHERTIRQAITDKRLKARRVGRDYIIYLRDLEKAVIYDKAGRPKISGRAD